MRALSVESDDTCPAGFIGEAARSRGYALERVVVDRNPQAFPSPQGIDVLLVTGSQDHWYEMDQHQHLQAELEFIRAAIADGARLFGMCFGGQALAAAHGGEVRHNGALELGWREVESIDSSLIPPGPWFEWHHDVFDVPEAGELLAWNEAGPQAFRIGPHLGLQFHPELTPAMFARWALELPDQVDREALIAETSGHAEQARTRAFALFDRFEEMT